MPAMREGGGSRAGRHASGNCNNSTPDTALGWELEGFLLATRCVSRVGGEAWMRAMMINKVRWRRWAKALRTEKRSGGVES